MLPLFLALSAFNLLALLITCALGWGVSSGRPWGTYHQLAGILATMTCVGVHCIVFTYFIATAKWAQHAVMVKRLDEAMLTPTRSFKAQAFPAAILAMCATCLAAFVGGATFSYQLRPIYHHLSAIVALATNLVCAIVEYSAISRNGKLIDRILAMIAAQQPAQAPVAERQTLRT